MGIKDVQPDEEGLRRPLSEPIEESIDRDIGPALAASSLKVAVYRELRNAEGIWVPAPVDPETSRKLEDAILVRARQIRIAELDGSSTG